MNNYQIEKKVKGSKTQVRILLDGVEIGKRTSARIYRFALVVKGNQAHALMRAKEGIIHSRKEAAKYRAVVNDEPGARRDFIHFTNGHAASFQSQQWHREYIEKGDVLKWAQNSEAEIIALEKRIERLASGPQPEFDEIMVCSWHQTRKNVPATAAYQTFVDVVEIPE